MKEERKGNRGKQKSIRLLGFIFFFFGWNELVD